MNLVYQSIRGILKAFLPTSCRLVTTSSRQAPKEGLLKKIGQTPVRLLHQKRQNQSATFHGYPSNQRLMDKCD